MFLFYVPELISGEVQLPDEEAHHLRNVLRLGVGSRLMVTDGKGLRCEAIVSGADKRSVLISTHECSMMPEPVSKVHLAVAPTKNADRFEWMVEKATEAGVSSITPLLCKHSERKTVNMNRLNKVMLSAARQSGRYWFPVINPPVDSHSYFSSDIIGSRFIAHCGSGAKAEPARLTADGDCQVVIGPEGDFSKEEISEAIAHRFQPVSLGDFRLRTETAALFAVIAFQVNASRNGK